jgi:transcription-repair coupling factor (superfamily II helicase)
VKSILTDCIRADSEYRHLLDALTRQRSAKQPLPVIAAGLCDGATDALTVSLLTDISGRGWGCALIVCAEEKECVRTVSILRDFGRSAVYFPARDLTLYNVTASHEFEYERLMVLSGILVGAYDAIVTTPDAALGYTIPPKRLREEMISLSSEDTVDVDDLCRRLAAAGFARVELTDGAGQFARRGGIIDIFPPYAVYDMGDCEKVGNLRSVIWGAWDVCMKI